VLLQGKNAVVYGGGGAIGGAVAEAFAREGARVYVAGRTPGPLEAVAGRIRAAGGAVETAAVDALDEAAVGALADRVAAEAGSLDVSFNAISVGDVQGTPMVEMSLADYLRPIDVAVRSTFVTARAAARHMVRQGGGVVLLFGGDGDPVRDYSIGGFQVALAALEAMRRQLSAELGRHGVRAVTLRTGGVPESIPAGMDGAAEIVAGLEASTLLGRTATLADVGNVAAFVASDRARTMTAATVNVSCGALVD
jgi:NAD(P)-dependent dehydrogenase (short-subunit alcohol dehydrogenase family)